MLAPSARNDSARSRVRLKTVRRCPDRNRLFAIPVPILPSPISPASILLLLFAKSLPHPPTYMPFILAESLALLLRRRKLTNSEPWAATLWDNADRHL